MFAQRQKPKHRGSCRTPHKIEGETHDVAEDFLILSASAMLGAEVIASNGAFAFGPPPIGGPPAGLGGPPPGLGGLPHLGGSPLPHLGGPAPASAIFPLASVGLRLAPAWVVLPVAFTVSLVSAVALPRLATAVLVGMATAVPRTPATAVANGDTATDVMACISPAVAAPLPMTAATTPTRPVAGA
jgi:hypothetical protein